MNKILAITAILMTAMFASGVLADSLILENKNPTTWAIISGDSIGATLTFNPVSPTFDYTLIASGLIASRDYALIYYKDQNSRFVNWGGDAGKVIATFTTDGSGNYNSGSKSVDLGINLPSSPDWNIAPNPDYCLNHNGFDSYLNCKGAKLWIVPKSDLTSDNSLPLDAWNPTTYLFETNLITYVDSSLSIGYASVICNQPTDCSGLGEYTCVNEQCVPKVCGMTATGGIFFGSIVPGAGWIHSGSTTTVTNTGNIPVTPKISGDNWVGSTYPGNGNAYMLVGATAWTTGAWESANYLTTTPTSIGNIGISGTATVWYELLVPATTPTDTYTQTITFGATC